MARQEYATGPGRRTAPRFGLQGAGAWLLGALACIFMVSHAACANDAPVRIVSFGTSLSEYGGWQEPLRRRLADCLARPVAIIMAAKSGSTSQWAVEEVDRVVAARPDVVLVEFYANDAALSRWMGVDASRANMEAVLGALRARAPQARVVVMAMNPMHGLKGAVLRPLLDDYIAAHADVAARNGQETLDFQPFWRARGDNWLRDAIPDGVHPSPQAASAVMVPPLVARLSDNRCPAPAP